jgi:long-chain acyl-CoA synthetase
VKDLFKTSKGKYVAPAPIEDKLGVNVHIEACCVVGANMGQPLGIAMLSPVGLEDLKSRREALFAELGAHLDAINAKLDPHEQLDCLVLIQTPWTVDNGFITPTFKVKRNRIEEVYGAKLEGWVAARKKVVLGD